MDRDESVSYTCVRPGIVSPDDLMAYLDHQARPEVVAHVASCPACAAQARRYARLDRQLRRRLHRVTCPPSQTLGDYQLDVLDPAERQIVAAHLLECSRCADELRTLRAYLADELPVEAPGPLETTLQALRRVVATLVSPAPGLAYAGLRGAAGASQTFRAGDVAVSIALGAPDRRGRSGISGLVTDESVATERAANHVVRLLVRGQPANRIVGTTAIDELGNFELDDVAPGTYLLEIDLDDQTIVIEDLPLGG